MVSPKRKSPRRNMKLPIWPSQSSRRLALFWQKRRLSAAGRMICMCKPEQKFRPRSSANANPRRRAAHLLLRRSSSHRVSTATGKKNGTHPHAAVLVVWTFGPARHPWRPPLATSHTLVSFTSSIVRAPQGKRPHLVTGWTFDDQGGGTAEDVAACVNGVVQAGTSPPPTCILFSTRAGANMKICVALV